MENISYGTSSTISQSLTESSHLEELQLNGYTCIPEVIAPKLLSQLSQSLDEIYLTQERDFGRDELSRINEADLVRCPLAQNSLFIELIKMERLQEILKIALGENYQLSLQNGIISRPNLKHHQSLWHRDLPYQELTTSKPLGVNLYFLVNDYTAKNGATQFLPGSHRKDVLPSNEYIDKNQVTIEAKAGSVIVFDCMVFHRAGFNSSEHVRRGINNLFTLPIIKQQIDLPRYLGGKYEDDPYLSKVLGYKWAVPTSVVDFRTRRL